MNIKDESILIEKLKDGDHSAFHRLFEEYKKMVFHYAYDLTGNIQEAEDISQEVFVRVYNGIKGFRHESSLKTWVMKITLNLCRNYHRRRKIFSFFSLSQESQEDEDEYSFEIGVQDDPAEGIYQRQKLRILRKAIMKLPRKQREVFIMKHLKEMKIKEIAEVLESPEGTVKANLFKAIRNFQILIKEIER